MRDIQSALPMKTSASPPLWNQKMRECSRKRPMMLITGCFAQPFPTWDQAAHAADDQFDLNACLGGFIQQGDDLRIDQGVHLGPDVAGRPCLGMIDFSANQGLHAFAQGDRSHQQFAEALLLGETRQVIE